MTSFSGVTFVLFCFVFVFMLSLKPRPFVQSSFDMQAPRQPYVFFFLRCRFFRVFFVPFSLSLCMESTSYVLSFRMVLFYLVTTGWIFDIGLCENSINQSIRPIGIQIATKSYATPQAMTPTNIKTVHQTSLLHIASNLDRLGLLSPTHDQRSQQ